MRSAVLLTLLRLVGMPVAVDIAQSLVFKRAMGRVLGGASRNDAAVYWRGLSSGMAHKATRSRSAWRWGPRGRWPIGQGAAVLAAELILLGASGPRTLEVIGEAAGRYIRRVPADVVAATIAGTILGTWLDLTQEKDVAEAAYRSFTYGLDELNGTYNVR